MRIAALPVGYADGFRRAPQNFGEVLVEGEFAQLVGRVSMDQSSIDVTHIPKAVVSSEVVLIGPQGDNQITAQQIADHIGTINYEVLTSLSERVTRIYKR
jgi:alanine racemase